MAVVTCPRCGKQNALGSNFCSSCGSAVPAPAAVDDTVTLAVVETDDPPATVVLDQGELTTPAVLVVTRGPDVGSRIPLGTQRLTAGRHPDSDLFLDDVTVSRRHAEILRTEQGFDIVDVGSLNGTYVNRVKVERVALRPGDEVQIGKFKLVFHAATTDETR